MKTSPYAAAFTCLVVSLVSCKKGTFDGTTALDPVGREYHQQQMGNQSSSSRYKAGEQITLRQTQTAVFNRNPVKFSARTEIVSAINATIVQPEGMFYKVKFEDGREGYINESDIHDPMEMFVTSDYSTEDFPSFIQEENTLPVPSSSLEEESSKTGNKPNGQNATIAEEDAKEEISDTEQVSEELPPPSSKI